MPPSRVTTRPRPTSRRSERFCLALPRCATGALPFAVSMNVAKLVMSSATDDTSTPDNPTIRTAISRLISSSCSRVTACIASQKYRRSSAGARILCRPNTRLSGCPALSPAGVTRWWLAGRVLLKIVYLLTCRVLGVAVLVFRGDGAKDVELLMLRHENAVLRRQVGRVRYEPADRGVVRRAGPAPPPQALDGDLPAGSLVRGTPLRRLGTQARGSIRCQPLSWQVRLCGRRPPGLRAGASRRASTRSCPRRRSARTTAGRRHRTRRRAFRCHRGQPGNPAADPAAPGRRPPREGMALWPPRRRPRAAAACRAVPLVHICRAQ